MSTAYWPGCALVPVLRDVSDMFQPTQFKYLATVLLALMLCQETHTLVGLLRQVADGQSISGLSQFLSRLPWSVAEVAGAWGERFHTR